MGPLISARDTVHIRTAAVALIAYTIVIAIVFFQFGAWANRGPEVEPGVATSVQPEVRHSDGSVTAGREPVKRAEPVLKPPPGAKVTGTASVLVQPKPYVPEGKYATGGDVHISGFDNMACSCEPVRVDINLLKDATGERLQFGSPNGAILEATHKPVLGEMLADPYRNAMGLTWSPRPAADAWGLMYQRDLLKRLRVGGKVGYGKEEKAHVEANFLFRF